LFSFVPGSDGITMQITLISAFKLFTCYFSALSRRLSLIAAICAALIMAGMTTHIMVEIFLRFFFSKSTYVLDEFVGYGVAATTFLALGYTFEKNALIRVNFILGRVRKKFTKKLIEITCVSLTLILSIFLSNYFWISISRNYARGSTSETVAQIPLWIPESFILIGLVIFSIQMTSYILRLITGDNLMSEK